MLTEEQKHKYEVTRQMAKEELNELEEQVEELEEEIKFLLIPKDPEDAKSAVVEIRAGTGGDGGASEGRVPAFFGVRHKRNHSKNRWQRRSESIAGATSLTGVA